MEQWEIKTQRISKSSNSITFSYDGGSELPSTQNHFILTESVYLGHGYAQIMNIFPGVHVIFDQIRISLLNSCSLLVCETEVILLIV